MSSTIGISQQLYSELCRDETLYLFNIITLLEDNISLESLLEEGEGKKIVLSGVLSWVVKKIYFVFFFQPVINQFSRTE